MKKKIQLISKIKNNFPDFLSEKIYIYRFDIFALSTMFVFILWFLNPLFRNGYIVFSDLDFGLSSKRYLEEIYGLWNERWSTATSLNMPRLLYILPFYILSSFFSYNGGIFLKSFVFSLIFISAFSMYLLSKRIISIYYSKDFDFVTIFALISGSLYYSLNPWVIFRIQHVYLLCGYSLLPLIIMFFFNAFDPKFQSQLIRHFDPFQVKPYRRNYLDLFLLAFIFNIASAAIHYFFYGALFLILLEFLLLVKLFIKYKNIKNFIKIIKNALLKILIFFIFFLLLGSYWFSIYVGNILTKSQASQHNINVIDTLSLFSRNSDFKNVISLMSYWWPMFDLNSLSPFFYGAGIIIIFFILYAIIFKSYKYNILLFFSFLSTIFFIFSTGVTYPGISSIFINVVIKLPVIGSIFRDPNKLSGLMVLGFSVLLSFALVSIIKKIKDNFYNTIIKINFIIFIIISFYFYLQPMYINFINGFYSAVTVPEDYFSVQNNFKDKDNPESKVFYLPFADNMTQSYTGVATPRWNINNNPDGLLKATGDYHIYSSDKNTVFIHEGNAQSITYYVNYLQYMLDRGLSRNIGNMVSAFGVNELAYHNEYIGKESRQLFNEAVLSFQKNLKLRYKNKIFKLYDINNQLPYIYSPSLKIFTPYGLSALEDYFNEKNFNLNDYGVIFTALDRTQRLKYLNKNDYMEIKNFNDIFFSNIPDSYFIIPFDSINDGNAFLKWSKTYVNKNDWLWYLSSQDISNFPFDFDYDAGMAITFATSKLDVMPYNMSKISGDLVADFDSLLKTENFFMPDNPALYSIQANPVYSANLFPVIRGEIIKGDPNNIWQVAKSGLIEAKENTPYRFNIIVSGRGTNKIHLKVRFFDSANNELGISYVVSPSEEIKFNGVNFYGEYVSPPNSTFMRVDLLTFQRPEQKTYWWVHDFRIENLEEYKTKNTFKIEKNFDNEYSGTLYARIFLNKKGGNIGITLNNSRQINIPTYNKDINQFIWIPAGKFKTKKGKNIFEIENLKGFNAINLLAFIPEEKKEQLEFPINKAIEKANIFSILEAENDFNYTGNIQSMRTYPLFSNGKSIGVKTGSLSKNFEIVKKSAYDFRIKLNFPKIQDAKVIFLLKKNNTIVYEKILTYNDMNSISENDIAIDTINNFDDFPHEIKPLKGYLKNYGLINLNNIFLDKGFYNLEIKIDSNVKSDLDFAQIHKFSPDEVILPDFIKADNQLISDGNDCIKITPDMMRKKQNGNALLLEFDKTCSSEWYNFASDMIPVNVDEEYYFSSEMYSENIRNRHMKLFFLDENRKIIKTVFINDVPEAEKNKLHKYEQIVLAPKNSKFVQFHILCKGNKTENGFIKINYLDFSSYRNFILLDNISFFEKNENTINDFFITDKKSFDISHKRIDKMSFELNIDKNPKNYNLINFCQSPNPLWEISVNGSKQRNSLNLNGVTAGFFVETTGKAKINIIMRELYYFSIILIFAGFLLFIIIYFIIFKNKR